MAAHAYRAGNHMEPFVHTSFIGDFVDVLNMKTPLRSDVANACVAQFGATARQEAVLSRYFGDLGLDHVAEFAASLDSLLTGSVQLVVLDFSSLNSFCRNAVAALVNFAASVHGRDKRLVLFRPGPELRRALDALALSHMFTVLDNEEELLLALPD